MVAVTGGIGAGKSELLQAFAARGVPVLSTDAVVHRLLQENDEVRAAVSERFGAGLFGQDREIDRSRLAATVFADPDELAWLEGLLHPLVYGEVERWWAQQARHEPVADICVVEVPLLYESGGESRFDAVVAVTASASVRAARGVSRLPERERRLLPEPEKLRRCDFAYRNDGSLEQLDAFAGCVLGELAGRRGFIRYLLDEPAYPGKSSSAETIDEDLYGG